MPSPMEDQEFAALPEILTVDEAARFLRIGRNSAYEAIRRGEIPAVRIGRRVLVPKRALGELLQAPHLVSTLGKGGTA